MTHHEALAIAVAWQEAANRRDAERLLELSDPEIELVGPRGAARGRELLRDWLGRAGLELTTRRAFAAGDRVVLEQHGVWRSPKTGAAQGEADVASVLRVVGGRVAFLARYDSLAEALAAAGIERADELTPVLQQSHTTSRNE